MVLPVDLAGWLKEQAWPLALIVGIILFTYSALKWAAYNRRVTLAKETLNGATCIGQTSPFSSENFSAITPINRLTPMP